jgi:hypothetical protein
VHFIVRRGTTILRIPSFPSHISVSLGEVSGICLVGRSQRKTWQEDKHHSGPDRGSVPDCLVDRNFDAEQFFRLQPPIAGLLVCPFVKIRMSIHNRITYKKCSLWS